MVRKIVQMLSLVALTAPLDINAIGLGDINVRSALNQSLNAEIELISRRPDELESLTVTLASSSAFAQAGLDRPSVLNQLRFQVETRSDGKPYLRVYTQEPVKEPFLNYLVEVNWASGHLLREYTVLLDPPSGLTVTAPVIQAPIVASSDTQPSIPRSKSLFEPIPVQQPTASAAPVAQTLASKSRINTTDQGRSYGPTQVGEGLWGIAKILLSKEDAANINQMMLALLKANPEAFLDNNVNTVRSGFVLRVPTPDEAAVLSQDEAMSVVTQHNLRWEDTDYRLALNKAALARSVAAEENAVADSVELAPVEIPESAAQLKLVPAPDDADTGSTPASQTSVIAGQPADIAQPDVNPIAESLTEASNAVDEAQTADIEKLSKELVLANESLEVKRLENEELSSRLAELETRTESIQRLVTLKNDELAVLQQSLVSLQSSTVAMPVNLEVTREQIQSPVAEVLPAPVVVQPVSITTNPVTDDVEGVDTADRGIALLRNAMTELSRNPLVQGVTALVALLLVSLLWIVNRRRRINARISESALIPVHTPAATSLKVASKQITPLETVIPPSAVATEPKQEEFGTTMENPDDRHQIQLKLLGIYHLTHSKNAFIAQAEALYADLAGEGGELWKKALVMGRDICPEHPLFADGSTEHLPANSGFTDQGADLPIFATGSSLALAGNDVAEDFPAAGETSSLWHHNDTHTGDNSIEFGSDFQTESLPVSGPKTTEDSTIFDLVAAQHEFAAFTDTELDGFEHQPIAETIVEFESEEESDKFANFSNDLEYKFDFDLGNEADQLAKSTIQADSHNSELSNVLEFNSGLPINNDEVGTKLELARAYIEMGDPEGAQGIIEEVMKEGSEDQKQVAQELLQQVG